MAEELPNTPFDASQIDVRNLWILVMKSAAGRFHAGHVYCWRTPESTSRDVVLMFRDYNLAEAFARELTRRGTKMIARSAPVADELTDLLANLKDRGVTHVVFDPHGPNCSRYPIDRIIIGLQLSE